MNGFFTQLVQRTLNTAQTIGPYIAPKFAQNNMEPEIYKPIEETGDLQQEPASVASPNDKPVLGSPPIKPAENYIQTTLLPAHQIQGKQPSNFANAIKAESLHSHDQVKPINDTKNDNVTITMPNENVTEIQAPANIDPHRPGQAVLANDDSIGRRSLDDTSLVPMPDGRTRTLEQSTTQLENFGNPKNSQVMEKRSADDTPLVSLPNGQTQSLAHSTAQLENFGSRQERAQSASSREQQNSESQTISVTIGRIDVRAVHPAPTPIKRKTAKTKPALSLDDYLQQRQRGER